MARCRQTCYDPAIQDTNAADDKAARERRFREAAHLQWMEGNPLTVEDYAMFEMFEREGWSEEQCIAYIKQQALAEQDAAAAEILRAID